MDAEKNVVEAARRARDSYFRFGGGMSPEHGNAMIALRAALYAYDSAPDPSEDRVREAAGRCVRALLMDSRCTEGDRLAIKKRGSDGNEHDLGAWSHDAALNVIAEALRPYVTPAPALPAGTVAVSVETLREIRRDAVSTHTMEGYPESSCSIAKTIDAILPPPKPEPPKELVAEWAREARAAAADLYISTKGQSADGFRSGYVARCRAEWAAAQKGGG